MTTAKFQQARAANTIQFCSPSFVPVTVPNSVVTPPVAVPSSTFDLPPADDLPVVSPNSDVSATDYSIVSSVNFVPVFSLISDTSATLY